MERLTETEMERLITTTMCKLEQDILKPEYYEKRQAWARLSMAQRRECTIMAVKRLFMKDWGEIPKEIKLDYIKLLEFPDRLRLRRSARTERALVDSLPINFWKVDFNNPSSDTQGSVVVYYPIKNSNGRDNYFNSSGEPIAMKAVKIIRNQMFASAIDYLAYVLKIGKIDILQIHETCSPDRFNEFIEVLEKSAPFKVKELQIQAKKSAVEFFLKNAEGLEKIEIYAGGSNEFPFDELLMIPSVANAKLLKIFGLCLPSSVSNLAKKWIENNAVMGSTILASVGRHGPKFIENFVEKFSDRIITQDDRKIRIRTDDNARHILLKYVERTENQGCISCSVIRSDLGDPTDGDHWTLSMMRWDDFMNIGNLWHVPTEEEIQREKERAETTDEMYLCALNSLKHLSPKALNQLLLG